MGTMCVKKVFLGSVTNLKALVMQQVSGNKSFPFLFGFKKSGALLVEYISGGFTLGTTQPPRTNLTTDVVLFIIYFIYLTAR